MQIPGLLLVVGGLGTAVWSFGLHPLLAGGLFALWVLKDAVMYPIVRVAYEPHEHDPNEHLLGARGVAQGSLDPDGWIKVGAELWRAKLADDSKPVPMGQFVIVVEVSGLTLIVESD